MTTATHTPPITLTLQMTPNRKLAHNASRGKQMWSIGAWNKLDRMAAYGCVASWYTEHQVIITPIHDPVRVTVTIYWGKLLGTDGKMRQARRLDWDSATALVKPTCDGALVDTGILADDRQIVAGTVLQEVDPTGEGFTTIEIERIDDANQ